MQYGKDFYDQVNHAFAAAVGWFTGLIDAPTRIGIAVVVFLGAFLFVHSKMQGKKMLEKLLITGAVVAVWVVPDILRVAGWVLAVVLGGLVALGAGIFQLFGWLK